jgi:hypothetical protein
MAPSVSVPAIEIRGDWVGAVATPPTAPAGRALLIDRTHGQASGRQTAGSTLLRSLACALEIALHRWCRTSTLDGAGDSTAKRC